MMHDYEHLEADADDEARHDAQLEDIRTNHGLEIRDEIERDSVLDSASFAHATEWADTERALHKAHKRLSDGEWEEAVFHAARAFDGYVQSVLARPMRNQTIERLERALSDVFSSDEMEAGLQRMTGAGSALLWAAAIVAHLDIDDKIVERFKMFVRNKLGVKWKLRNDICHTAISTEETTARSFVQTVKELLEPVATQLHRRYEALRHAEQIATLNPARVYALQRLANFYDIDPAANHDLSEIVELDAPKGIDGALWRLLGQGYVYRNRLDVFSDSWRLTSQGRGHYRVAVEPHLGEK